MTRRQTDEERHAEYRRRRMAGTFAIAEVLQRQKDGAAEAVAKAKAGKEAQR